MENATVNRASGVLLHITSLPGGEGIGDLGKSARTFVDWLAEARQSWWQVLPCGEVGFGESPYQSRSAYAGNPLLISLRELVDKNLLDEELVGGKNFDSDTVNFRNARTVKERALRAVCAQFKARASADELANFDRFTEGLSQHWLHDYARFSVLKARYGSGSWTAWPDQFAQRDPQALAVFDAEEAKALEAVKIVQYVFASQWQALRQYAGSKSISLLGDCPIYVASDSADVWCAPELFDLHEDGNPRTVAGVPPDYFSATGQLWGNPLYRWDRAEADNFEWWRARVKHCAQQFDLTRIDHFRGLDAFWEVPADAPDASTGCWKSGPGAVFLRALQEDFPTLPLVAEDLGDLTPSVHELREQFKLPGMRVLQFGFDGGDDNPHAPERIAKDVICYAGTHDNNTTLGWINTLQPDQFNSLCERYSCDSAEELLEAILNEVINSPAELAVFAMQDLLGLPESARFNTPGTVGCNWQWRMRNQDLTEASALRLAQLTLESQRCDSRIEPLERLKWKEVTNGQY